MYNPKSLLLFAVSFNTKINYTTFEIEKRDTYNISRLFYFFKENVFILITAAKTTRRKAKFIVIAERYRA